MSIFRYNIIDIKKFRNEKIKDKKESKKQKKDLKKSKTKKNLRNLWIRRKKS